ncbi:PREDICTED: F-box protein CPR30-like [Ipomoea nil]|uniref:F-box protein CPR30-like n=1 Tax=Ipomoea nil TaxID=35883 RepID=UPI0009015DD0|nr:PREDICTED: F-box protein CPR30-like [Ipomoea nil]
MSPSKLNNPAKMCASLPIDLWAQILARLPAKSILRCTTVSRSWYSLIKTPFFISKHLNFNSQNENRSSCLLVRSCINPREEIYEFCDDDRYLIKFVEFRAPFKAENPFFRIIGCCNGLIFLSDDFFKNYHDLILWNPFIGRSVCLPDPNFVHFKHSLGFGFDPVMNDYKVVNVVDVGLGIASPKVEIFRLSKRVWEEISDNALAFSVPGRSSQAYLNGAVHWVGQGMLNGELRNLIVRFDMSKERFGMMELPESLATLPFICVAADVYMGSLAVVVLEDNSRYSIWIMKDYDCVASWTKQVSFIFPESAGIPFGFRGNGDVQVMTTYGQWHAYDPKGPPHYKYLGVCEFKEPNLLFSFHASPFVESLAFLDASADFDDASTVQNLSLRRSRRSTADNDDK